MPVDIEQMVNRQAKDSELRKALADLLPELRAFARFLTGSRTEADDLVQEALMRTLQSLDERADDIDLRAWCLAVIRNIFHENIRSRKREAVRLRENPAPDFAPAAQEAPGNMRDLARALGALSPLLREALVLVGAQGLSYEQASVVCGVPVGTVKARVSRARRQLARALDRVMG
ncbi:MAG: sigma-70 family RNA polymerase sigma factor [Acetobacteraceae bacterium]|nr:sigma-70 family RNA polymerase sigma factor [Acetobacteraceae bacterium]